VKEAWSSSNERVKTGRVVLVLGAAPFDFKGAVFSVLEMLRFEPFL
jgi:hypothetical protein